MKPTELLKKCNCEWTLEVMVSFLSVTLLLKDLGGSQGTCYTIANLNLFTLESERTLFVSC